ncbi:Predicted transcriptional regulator, ArsR family [Paraoerskovia marina]|uniref:Predicted transcriptional regulator, ArsR family n=1 Tax=Paraoerskovia marina TaxID=545619 RepID=A0A1H1TGM3_9CELL|nr:helix-turn-helix domain-containing protein [Paraoerskovia marina]SDS59382.1 Predicted transcriptional regulator, ArsR family [Paraoerskovia marina]
MEHGATRQFDLADTSDESTRERVLRHVVTDGPVAAATLASTLGLTPAGVRRHLGLLEADGLIAPHVVPPTEVRRGRPARRFVATEHGQSSLTGAYPELAGQALRYLRSAGGDEAVAEFARLRLADLASRRAKDVDAETVADRVVQLADVLSDEGYAASVRPTGGSMALQLCQGHCPIQHVAAEFPELCEAEARVFSELLGSHVQRLATLAGGAHACTTNVPIPVDSLTTRTTHTVPGTRKD